MPLLNYTTSVPIEKSIGEIQRMLASRGVQGVLTEYDGPHVAAVSFRMLVSGEMISFRLPCSWRAVQEVFKHKNSNRIRINGRLPDRINDTQERATAVAWRIIKDWTEAQLALVELNQTTIPQVFLSHAITKSGETLGERMMSDPKFLLGSGK